MKKIWKKVVSVVETYPIVTAGIVIYLYYLLASINVFRHTGERQTVLDYVMDYDSLFFLWIAAAAFLQILKMRKSNQEEQNRRREMEQLLERQRIHTQLVNEITLMLQDSVNNPLALIGVTTQEMRKRFAVDADVVRSLDRIEGAMQRIHNTIRDIQIYETQKMVEKTNAQLLK
jgi:large-conductance mechanosensitive channel